MFFRFRRASILLVVLMCVIFVSLLAPNQAQAISGFSATVVSIADNSYNNGAPACTYLSVVFRFVGNADFDWAAGKDAISVEVLDGNNNQLSTAWTSVALGPFDYVSSPLPTRAGMARPLTFRFYGAPTWYTGASSHFLQEIIIDPADYVPACASLPYVGPPNPIVPSSTDPTIVNELQRGISRNFDDGVVIAEQPNRDLDYYTPDGCMIGKTTSNVLGTADLSTRHIVESLSGCGYEIDVWSLGYPACQLQVNMYNDSTGYSKEYQLPRQPGDRRCSADTLSQQSVYLAYEPIQTGTALLPEAELGYVWISRQLYEAFRTEWGNELAQLQEQISIKGLAEDVQEEVVKEVLCSALGKFGTAGLTGEELFFAEAACALKRVPVLDTFVGTFWDSLRFELPAQSRARAEQLETMLRGLEGEAADPMNWSSNGQYLQVPMMPYIDQPLSASPGIDDWLVQALVEFVEGVPGAIFDLIP